MKTFSTLLLLGFFFFSSCDDGTNDNQSSTAAKTMEVENRAINGEQWRITNFTHASIDHTSVFNGYIFEFDSNNLLTSTNGSENISGSWYVKTTGDADKNKTEFDEIDFSMVFTNPPSFADIAGNWKILSITDSKIELRHSGATRSQEDIIRFERI
jgi:hypothetical protein